jgi:predicted O-methyltransferase YrrM
VKEQNREVPDYELARMRRPEVVASIERSRTTFADAASGQSSASRLHTPLRGLQVKVRILPQKVYELAHPNSPWISQDAVRYLDRHLDRHGAGFEFGSGRSTAWLAQRLGSLTSVEDNPEWYEKVQRRLTGLPHVQLLLRSIEGDEGSPYIAETLKVANHSLSFALVDGQLREQCVIALLPKMAAGGLLAVDDTFWPGFATFQSETIPWERVYESGNAVKHTTIWAVS